ncbi:MAG: hypothetical protein C0603_05755 [Denitrovibrio sp.]|nr:MAG: hypothetical protein C0603_05755 [Denitrovibrio sp.]
MRKDYDKTTTINKLQTAIDLIEKGGNNDSVSEILLQVIGQGACNFNCVASDTTFFQNILDILPVPVYYKDIYGIYVGCNNALAKLYGREKRDIIGKTVFDIFTQSEAQVFSYSDMVLINEDSHEMVEHKGRYSAMGGTYYIINKKVLLDSDNTIIGVLGVVNDMTEHKQNEERAWQGEAFYKSLYEKSPRPCVIFDSLNNIEDMNFSAFHLLGEQSDYVGGDISAIFKSNADYEKMMTSNGEPVQVCLVNAEGNEIEAIASLTLSGLTAVERYSVSFIIMDSIK